MARRRQTPGQVVRKLREADRLLGKGAWIADVARHLEVSDGVEPPGVVLGGSAGSGLVSGPGAVR